MRYWTIWKQKHPELYKIEVNGCKGPDACFAAQRCGWCKKNGDEGRKSGLLHVRWFSSQGFIGGSLYQTVLREAPWFTVANLNELNISFLTGACRRRNAEGLQRVLQGGIENISARRTFGHLQIGTGPLVFQDFFQKNVLSPRGSVAKCSSSARFT